jgi:adenylate kinase
MLVLKGGSKEEKILCLAAAINLLQSLDIPFDLSGLGDVIAIIPRSLERSPALEGKPCGAPELMKRFVFASKAKFLGCTPEDLSNAIKETTLDDKEFSQWLEALLQEIRDAQDLGAIAQKMNRNKDISPKELTKINIIHIKQAQVALLMLKPEAIAQEEDIISGLQAKGFKIVYRTQGRIPVLTIDKFLAGRQEQVLLPQHNSYGPIVVYVLVREVNQEAWSSLREVVATTPFAADLYTPDSSWRTLQDMSILLNDDELRSIIYETPLIEFLAERQPLPRQVELMLVLGSNDLRVPVEAAQLYHQLKPKYVLVSGGIGLSKHRTFATGESEAEIYKRIMVEHGVPQQVIIMEDKSRLAGENIYNSLEILRRRNIRPDSVLLVQNPTAQKRALAVFNRQFPLQVPGVQVTSYAAYIPILGKLTPEEYVNFCCLAVEETTKIIDYQPFGADFIDKVEIPFEVLKIYHTLRRNIATMTNLSPIKPVRLILFGRPGSGKGTYAQLLEEKYGIPQISVSALLKKINPDTELGARVRQIMASGELVSDEVVLEVLQASLNSGDYPLGFILDGFPRNRNQLGLLGQLIQGEYYVINIDVPEEIIYGRIEARRSCEKCGASVNRVEYIRIAAGNLYNVKMT